MNLKGRFNMSLRLRMLAEFAFFFVLTVIVAIPFSPTVSAQTTISTGSIQGTIADQSGAVVTGARVTITNKATGQALTMTSTSSGAYTSGSLIPGDYTVRVESKGFKTVEAGVTVQVGVTASGNIKLELGQESQVVEVQAS